MLVTPSHFTEGDLIIPNALPQDTGVEENRDLWSLIVRHERELLQNVLGDMYVDHLKVVDHIVYDWYGNTYLTDGCNILKGGDNLLVTPDVVEHSYKVSGTLEVQVNPEDWEELYFGEGQLQRCATLYVYCKWLEKDEIKEGTLGFGKLESEGLNVTDNSQKYVNRWNEFVHVYYNETRHFLATHPKFKPNGTWFNRNNSSFGFYPETRNSFGL